MKPATLPILCGAALAIMAGAAGSHFASVRQMVAIAESGVAPASIAPAPGQPGAPATLDTRSMIAELERQNAAMEQHLASSRDTPVDTASAPSSPELNRVLTELLAINRELRSQIAETNRDLMELRFQVDTHSEQFRPLNTVDEPVEGLQPYDINDGDYDTSIGVLPPLDL